MLNLTLNIQIAILQNKFADLPELPNNKYTGQIIIFGDIEITMSNTKNNILRIFFKPTRHIPMDKILYVPFIVSLEFAVDGRIFFM